MYRPDKAEWVENKNNKMIELEDSAYPCREAYEAGADAMLEALKEMGIRLSNLDLNAYGRILHEGEDYPKSDDEVYGHLVFIPEG